MVASRAAFVEHPLVPVSYPPSQSVLAEDELDDDDEDEDEENDPDYKPPTGKDGEKPEECKQQ